MKPLQLIFVYNANSDLFSAVTDFVHKIVAPQTYQCSLCTLTYGNLKMKQEWKDFLDKLPIEKTFLHKDEFEKLHHQTVDLPAVFCLKEGRPIVLITSDAINKYKSLNELMQALQAQLQMLKVVLYD